MALRLRPVDLGRLAAALALLPLVCSLVTVGHGPPAPLRAAATLVCAAGLAARRGWGWLGLLAVQAAVALAALVTLAQTPASRGAQLDLAAAVAVVAVLLRSEVRGAFVRIPRSYL